MSVTKNGVEYDNVVIELPVVRKYYLNGVLVAEEVGSAVGKSEIVSAAQKDLNVTSK